MSSTWSARTLGAVRAGGDAGAGRCRADAQAPRPVPTSSGFWVNQYTPDLSVALGSQPPFTDVRRRALAHRGHLEGPDRHLPAGRPVARLHRAVPVPAGAERRHDRHPVRVPVDLAGHLHGRPRPSRGHRRLSLLHGPLDRPLGGRRAGRRHHRHRRAELARHRRPRAQRASCGSPSASRRPAPDTMHVDGHLRRPGVLHPAVVDHAHVHARQARRPAAALHLQREQQGRRAPAAAPAEPELQAHAGAGRRKPKPKPPGGGAQPTRQELEHGVGELRGALDVGQVGGVERHQPGAGDRPGQPLAVGGRRRRRRGRRSRPATGARTCARLRRAGRRRAAPRSSPGSPRPARARNVARIRATDVGLRRRGTPR